MNKESIEELLNRGVAEVIDRKHLETQLKSGKKLRVKLGLDSNKPDLHIGHAVPLMKLREFQDAGHKVVIILGDATAQLGDPSEKSETRTMLDAKETKKNADKFLDQIFKILDKKKTEIRRNSEWFDKFNLTKVLELLSLTTINQLLSHETFRKRIQEGQALHAQEIVYPLMQGYDSMMIKADVEFGAMEQKFNVLMGRDMQRAHNMPQQDVMLFPYLTGTDGQQKMSKSLGNTININDEANDMFGKVMSIPDTLIVEYFTLATKLPASEIDEIDKELKKGVNPRTIKVRLATEIVTLYHGAKEAANAAAEFDKVFSKKEKPSEIEEVKVKNTDLISILVETKLATSKSEAKRLLQQKGVKVDDELATEKTEVKSGNIIQVGKRKFIKLK